MADAKHITEQLRTSLQGSNFWQQVFNSEAGSCWPWIGTKTGQGYGRFFFGREEFRAHRVAFALAKNTALPGVVMVCHRCDNPECCNPDHLFLGEAKDNNADTLAKGRQITPRAKANGNGKLSDEDVQYVLSSKERGAEVARQLGVSPALVSMIRSGSRRMVGDTSFELVTYRV
jgi:hypothetical protein